MKDYDIIALGGGSGGLAVAETAAKYGKKVAIIDPNPLGGTCVNAGCVPKKVMWYAAETSTAVDNAPAFGLPVQTGDLDWPRLVASRRGYIAPINQYWAGHVSNLGIDRIEGQGVIVGPHSVEVNGVTYEAERIVIATGGRPIVPPLEGAQLGVTSDGFFQLEDQPKRVAIIGAGYIGVELAGVLSSLGSRVSIFGLEERALEVFDPMVSEAVERSLRDDGVQLHLGFQVEKLMGRKGDIFVCNTDGDSVGSFDAVIWAVGRRPNTDAIGLQNVGLTPLRDGTLDVDQWQQTEVESIYAIGDVIGKAPLTPVAIAAGRRLATHWFAENEPVEPVDYDQVPSVVFAHPPVATMGLKEAEAREQHDQVTVYQTGFTPMKYAFSEHAKETVFKLICAGEEEKIVGIHLVGDSVDEMLQGFAVAINMEATKKDFDRTIAIHPTSSEELVTLKPENRL